MVFLAFSATIVGYIAAAAMFESLRRVITFVALSTNFWVGGSLGFFLFFLSNLRCEDGIKLLRERVRTPLLVAANRNEERAAKFSTIQGSVGQPMGDKIELMEFSPTATAVPRRLEGHHFGIRTMTHVEDEVFTVLSVRFAAFNDT
jgi:hypothetical protein